MVVTEDGQVEHDPVLVCAQFRLLHLLYRWSGTDFLYISDFHHNVRVGIVRLGYVSEEFYRHSIEYGYYNCICRHLTQPFKYTRAIIMLLLHCVGYSFCIWTIFIIFASYVFPTEAVQIGQYYLSITCSCWTLIKI